MLAAFDFVGNFMGAFVILGFTALFVLWMIPDEEQNDK